MTDSWLYRTEVSLIVGAVVVIGLWRLMLALDRRGFTRTFWLPVAVGLILRLVAVVIAAAEPSIGHKLASTDEVTFIATAKTLAALPLTSSKWLSMTVHWTEVIPWSLTYKVFGDCGPLPLRLEQIGFSLTALVIASAVAGRIGGRRAGLIAAWIMAIEPSSVYFAGLLHQESLCMVGDALLLSGLVDAWTCDAGWRGPSCVVLAGLALVFGTRSYMAFFVAVAVILVLIGAELCRRFGQPRGLSLLTLGAVALALIGILAAPHVVPDGLANLQHQLDFHYAGANLPLPHTTVTDSAGLLKTIVARSLDLVTRPFPWQVASAAQKAAVAGTLIWYLLVVVTFVLTVRQGLDGRLVPALILSVCETFGFAMTLVDAGEGFRHRVNLVLLIAVPLGVMLDRWLAGRRQPKLAVS
jgi:Dolichyl-phosphate-mannose-protein mannosyltransferase